MSELQRNQEWRRKIPTSIMIRYGICGILALTLLIDCCGEEILTAPKIVELEQQNCEVVFGWEEAGNARAYRVYRSTQQGGTYERIHDEIRNLECRDRVPPGITYFYIVSAFNDRRIGELSVPHQITVNYCITGAALDSRSGDPIPGVQVSLNSQSPRSFPNGHFVIEVMKPGAFHLEARKEGYLPAVFDGVIEEQRSPDLVEIWLRPIPRVSGTIDGRSDLFRVLSDICFSSDGTRAYVSDELGGISAIDSHTDAVTRQNLDKGYHLTGIAVHPHGGEIYVADVEAHEVVVFNAKSLNAIDTISVDKRPQQLLVSQDGRWLYVVCQGTGTVLLVDTRYRSVEFRSSVGREPYGITLSPDESILYVANSADNSVSVIDASNGQPLGTISVGGRPRHLAASEDYVYISCEFGDRVSVIGQTSHSVVKDIGIGNRVLLSDLAVLKEPNGGDVIYVLDQTNSSLHLIDRVTLQVLGDGIPVGDIPSALAIRPDLGKIYVVNSGSANVSVLEF